MSKTLETELLLSKLLNTINDCKNLTSNPEFLRLYNTYFNLCVDKLSTINMNINNLNKEIESINNIINNHINFLKGNKNDKNS
mgnify:CR=1 FL=1